jgi:tight adherence protein B
VPVGELLAPSTVAVIVGLGAALVAFGMIGEVQRLVAGRRVLRFVGHRLLRPGPGRSWTWDARASLSLFQRVSRIFFSSQSTIQNLLLALILGALVFGMISGSVAAFTVGAIAALLQLSLASRVAQQDRIERQMPVALRLMTSGLRAGLSIPQALALVARESPEPTASEFARTKQEVDLGLSLDEALRRLADRTTRDYAFVSTMVSVHYEVGGNLVPILEGVEETLRERAELRQHAAALTAQQRLSSLILTGLPIFVFLYILVINGEYLAPVLESITGRLAILLAAGLLLVGWAAIRWLGRIDE